jgi:enamine deaminase RidA (YjgF/YER057c/UK114 family)
MKILKPDTIFTSPRYAPGVRVGNTIYTAGRVPIDLNGEVVAPNDVRAQTEQILDCLETIVAEGGATLRDVVHIRTYYLHQEDMPAIFEVLQARMGTPLPPHTGCRQLSCSWEKRGIRLEIEVTAVVENKSPRERGSTAAPRG